MARNKKEKLKKHYQNIGITFLGLLLFFIIVNLIVKDKSFSTEENRMLASKPEFTMEQFKEGRYMKKYDTYRSDQFAFRDFWVHFKVNTDRMLGKNQSNGVFYGKEHTLIEEFAKPDPSIKKDQIAAINTFSKKHSKLTQYLMLVPNAVSIWEDRLPYKAPIQSQQVYIKQFYEDVDQSVKKIDVAKVLKEHKKEAIYYRTDHHWTTKGAYYGFLAAAKVMGIEADKVGYEMLAVSSDFKGTLASKSGYSIQPLDEIDIYVPQNIKIRTLVTYVDEKQKKATMYNTDALKQKDKYELFFGGNHPLIKIDTDSKSQKVLLILKDSYANSMVPFLTPYYQKIIMVDPRYYYENINDLINEENVTDLLYLYNCNTFSSDTSLKGVLEFNK